VSHAVAALPQAPAAGPVAGRNPAWPAYVLFMGLPAWWLLGASHFVWPVVAGFMVLSLLIRPDVRVPGNLAIWALFLAWMLVSALAIDTAGRAQGFALRFVIYLSAGIVYLWLVNSPQISSRALVSALGGYWALVVLGGYLGILFPTTEFHTPIEQVIPGSLLANDYVHHMTHARFAEVQDFLGYPLGRPTTFFTYTNGWGSAFALLTPFAVAAFAQTRSRRWRRTLGLLFVLSLVPVVVSLNRGLWISLIAAGVYMWVRVTVSGKLGTTVRALCVAAVLAVVVIASPLGDLVEQRLSHGHSNAARVALYNETFARIGDSPLIGYGAPRPAQGSGYLDSVGTQGQVLYLVFSHGYPGLLLFFAWLGHAFFRSVRAASPARLAGHVALLIAAIQAPFYGIQMQMFIIVAAAVVALRPEHGLAQRRLHAA
jgi:polysaccharide biosynthesis protein PslJ